MKYLIAGASGFIGKAIVRSIKRKDPDAFIIGLSRNRPTSLIGIDEYLECDLSQNMILNKDVDVVINAAGEANYALSDAELDLSHRRSSRNLMTWANDRAVEKYIHISTASVYLRAGDVSFVSETDIPDTFFNAYAKVKRLVETDLESDFTGQGLFIIRPRMVIGPGDKSWLPAIENELNRRVLLFSDNLIQPTSVDHLAHSVVHLANLPINMAGVYNVCGSEVLSLRDMIEPLLQGRKLIIPWPKRLGKAVLNSGLFKSGYIADQLFNLSCEFTMDCSKILQTGFQPPSETVYDVVNAYLNASDSNPF